MISSSLKKFADPLGFENKNGRLFGNYRGYTVTLAEGMGNKRLMIGVAMPTDDPCWNQIAGFIETNRKDSRIESFSFHPSHITIILHDAAGTMKRLEELLDKTVKALAEAMVPGNTACWYCNTAFTGSNPDKIQVNEAVVPMHSACIENYNQSIQQASEEFKNQPKNYLRGLLGAVLGGLVGVIPWVIVYLVGYFVGWLGLLIGFTAKKGYEILGGRPGKAKPWIILLVVILSVFLGQFMAESIGLYNDLIDEGYTGFTILDMPSVVVELVTYEPEYQRAMLSNVGLGLLFAFAGIWGLFRDMKHEGKGSIATTKKLN